MAGPADALSFDLEDAVEESRKPAARVLLSDFLRDTAATQQHKRIVVRINAVDTAHCMADLEAVVQPGLHIVNLPKAESREDVIAVVARLEALEQARNVTQPIGILANIESPRGLACAREIAAAHPRVMGLQIGYGDLFSPLGIPMAEPFATQAVRFAVRMAAGEAGIDAYDGAYVAIDDPDGYRRDATAALHMGFAGKSCIHPSQVGIANEMFRPGQAEVDHSVRVLQAAQEALARGVGAFVVDGRLVDGPFITRAERVVALARRLGMLA